MPELLFFISGLAICAALWAVCLLIDNHADIYMQRKHAKLLERMKS